MRFHSTPMSSLTSIDLDWQKFNEELAFKRGGPHPGCWARLEQLILLKHWFSEKIGEIHVDVAPRFGLPRLRFGAGMGLGGGGLVCLARGGSAICAARNREAMAGSASVRIS